MNSHILKLCIFGLLYKITHYTSNQRNVLSFVRGQTDEHGNLNIDLTYNGDEKKRINLELDKNIETVDSPLIIILPTENVSPSRLYENYLKQTENPKYISVKNVLNNMVNTFEPIEQKAFINKLSDEINTRIKFYESFSI
ncbi:conserved Plasmodium protein, unknown function [Plasmodium malariae]|uniref:Uncharacterized protein n=1 Tax=Plasmodium malariae TaxID=5858 RepID=A0A1D3PA29_PLAMA|nr:conserved Plasmodium protein, unknown function [Plasmodium malariae]SCN12096.1 conserved Plasmodium protein, unknown function [Plasmodium malariae]